MVKGEKFFFSGPKSEAEFFEGQKGGGQFAFGAIPSWIHLSENFHAFGETFLFSIIHALYHVHIEQSWMK